ncbi:sensor histidine kinase [Panacagrimonas sp.]|uniref:sensor histidine kinase n=1 Tax=Panacagrimonas sp. TaxID=2480088 RepID=UPI003B52F10F
MRPRLSTVLILIHLVILLLPLGGIAVLRVYESALIRQTESELIAQGVFISATYRTLLADGPALPADYGVPRRHVEPRADPDGPWRPRLVSLDLATDPVLPPPPEPQPGTIAPDAIAAAVGAQIEPILRDAQVITLAGIRVLDVHGTIVATTGGDLGLSMAALPEAQRALAGEYVSLMRQRGSQRPPPPLDSISRGARIRVAVAVPILADDRVIGAVTLLRTPGNIWQALRGKRRELAWAGAALLLTVLGLSLLTAVTIGRPVRAVIRQARRAARGESGAVVPLRHAGTREIAELSQTVAAMARTLEERARYIRDFAAHVSHEFKTPLTAIRGTVELLRDHAATMNPDERERFLALLESDAARLDRLVSRLLELARADMARPGAEPVITALSPLLQALAQRYRERGLAVDLQLPATNLHAAIDAETLDAILSTVLDNARQHGGADTRVALHLHAHGGELAIDVIDNGKGISEHNAARVFEPFFTTARDGGHTGLGLSIVRSLLQAHGGHIALQPSPSGAHFCIGLPWAEPSQ